MPRYERDGGKDVRFWEITRDGRTLHTRTGRRGTQGKTTAREHASDEDAADAYERAIAEKLAAGYVLASGPATAEQLELEAALVRDPDDPGPYLVLADVLQAAGDPRGELIALHAALAAAPRDAALELAVKRQLDAHAGVLLGGIPAALATIGPLFGRDAIDLQWRLGYIRALRIAVERGGAEITRLLKAVLGARSAMVLTALEVRTGILVERVYNDLVDAVARRSPPTLRELRLANKGAAPGRRLTGLGAKLPRLRELELPASALDERELAFPHLVELALHGALAPQLDAVVAGPPPQLRTLHATLGARQLVAVEEVLRGGIPTLREVAFQHEGLPLQITDFELGAITALQLGTLSPYTAHALARGGCAQLVRLRLVLAGDVTAPDLAPILDGACTRLRELDLSASTRTSWTDAVLDAPVLRQLEALTLWHLDVADLRAVIARAGALVHLRRLRLHHLGTPACAALFDEARQLLQALVRIDPTDGPRYPWALP